MNRSFRNKATYLQCRCGSFNHTIRLMLFDEPGEPDLYLDVNLVKFGFFKRLWTGIKYILGISIDYTDYAEFILSPEDVDTLMGVLQDYKTMAAEEKPGPGVADLEEFYSKLKEGQEQTE